MQIELKPCPFCGWHMDGDRRDIHYPTGSYAHWIDPNDHSLGLHFNRDPNESTRQVWKVVCTENMGGCGAQVHGLGPAGAVIAWNRRAAAGATPPDAPGTGPFTLQQMVAFLCGEAPLDGVWFGNLHPGQRGQFWWRKFLRAAVAEPADGVPPSEAPQPAAWRWKYGDTDHHPWVVMDSPPPKPVKVFRLEPLYPAILKAAEES